jgi:hypothetical protein
MTAAAGMVRYFWINGYSEEMFYMCGYTFKGTEPASIHSSTQASNATSYGTQYELISRVSICVMQTQQVTLTILVEWTLQDLSLVMEQEEGLNQ